MKQGRKEAARVRREALVKDLKKIFDGVKGKATVKDHETWDKAFHAAELHINRLTTKYPQEKSFYESALFEFKQEVYQGVMENV